MTTERVGQYELLQKLATGGMAEVYLSRHKGPQGFSKPVALKRILPALAKHPDFVTQFLDEARLAAQLSHPHVVQILTLGEEQHVPFIAMEYVHGADAAQLIKRLNKSSRLLPIHLACRIAMDACEGLHYAHKKVDEAGNAMRIVHRDVSPHNLLISFDGNVKVADFGIARAAMQLHHTLPGVVKGKYPYMAPEQIRSMPFDHRADEYALALVLYELLTGVRYYDRATDVLTMQAVAEGKVEAPSKLRPEIPKTLDDIVLKALSKDPTERYPDLKQFGLALEEFLLDEQLPSSHSLLAELIREVFAEYLNEDPTRSNTMVLHAGTPNGTPHGTPGSRPLMTPARPATRTRQRVKRRKFALAGGAAALVAVLVGAGVFWAVSRGPATGPTAPTGLKLKAGQVKVMRRGQALLTQLSDEVPLHRGDVLLLSGADGQSLGRATVLEVTGGIGELLHDDPETLPPTMVGELKTAVAAVAPPAAVVPPGGTAPPAAVVAPAPAAPPAPVAAPVAAVEPPAPGAPPESPHRPGAKTKAPTRAPAPVVVAAPAAPVAATPAPAPVAAVAPAAPTPPPEEKVVTWGTARHDGEWVELVDTTPRSLHGCRVVLPDGRSYRYPASDEIAPRQTEQVPFADFKRQGDAVDPRQAQGYVKVSCAEGTGLLSWTP